MNRWRTLLAWTGVLCFLLPLIPLTDPQVHTSLGISAWQQPMMPLSALVITPETLLTVVALSLGALCWLVYGILWLVSSTSSGEVDDRYRATGRLRKILHIVGRVIVTLLVLWGMMVAGFTLLFANKYHVLTPRSAAGCAVIVSFSESMVNSAGKVYIKQPDSPWLRDTGGTWSQVHDVVADPISEGTWSLTWQDRNAHIDIWGHDGSVKFDAAPHKIACAQ